MKTGKIMMANEHNVTDQHQDINHVGGINDELGGVDPRADENLLRLAGWH